MERIVNILIALMRSSRVLKVVISILVGGYLFLLSANILGFLEVSLLKALHADVLLLTVGNLAIRTSTLLFLLTLIVLLSCLVLILLRVLKPKKVQGRDTAKERT